MVHPEKWEHHFTEAVNAGLDGNVANISIGETSLNCLIASIHETRVQGLSEAAQLPHDGMLFMYEGNHTAKFTRQAMSMDVSIWFFDAQGNPVGSGWTDDVATANEPYRYVVETHADAELDGKLRINHLVREVDHRA